MKGTRKGMHGGGSRPLRTGAAALCLAALLLGGCAGTKDRKPKYLSVPVTYERHLEAVRNCKPIGAMTYHDFGVPNEENLLGLSFALHKASESSTRQTGSGDGTWKETSSKKSEAVGFRLFRCPPEFLRKVRAEMKGGKP